MIVPANILALHANIKSYFAYYISNTLLPLLSIAAAQLQIAWQQIAELLAVYRDIAIYHKIATCLDAYAEWRESHDHPQPKLPHE